MFKIAQTGINLLIDGRRPTLHFVFLFVSFHFHLEGLWICCMALVAFCEGRFWEKLKTIRSQYTLPNLKKKQHLSHCFDSEICMPQIFPFVLLMFEVSFGLPLAMPGMEQKL